MPASISRGGLNSGERSVRAASRCRRRRYSAALDSTAAAREGEAAPLNAREVEMGEGREAERGRRRE